MIHREIPLTLLNYSKDAYVYKGSQNVENATIKYYFANSSGVPSRIEIFQF